MNRRVLLVWGVFQLISLSGCGNASTPSPEGRLVVVATTSIVGDVVAQVGGTAIDLTLLMPVGTDPHEYSPRPRDVAELAAAEIIFANGAGLEEFLLPLIENAGATSRLVNLSDGVPLITLAGQDGTDPHTWMDPNNVIIWVDSITAALSQTDPAHAADFRANAVTYTAQLQALDVWIRAEVDAVAPENRFLVCDHAVLGYFAQQYDFIQAGSITNSFTSESAPSARELARLEDEIRAQNLKAIFVTERSNQMMAIQIAEDLKIQAVWLYHASLSDTSGPASTYLDFMRYNVNSLVNALK